MRGSGVARTICILAGLFYLVFGIWAFVAPQGFFDSIAGYPPYNEHLIHDIGAFEIGIGASLFAGLRWRDALTAVLVGAATGSIAHAAAHWMDRDLGGKASDPWFISLLAIMVIVGAVLRAREDRT
jgi:hypothetical protein